MSSSIADLCSARVGTTINGKWRLERVIGVGAMAAVYEASHKIGRKEALKILHPEVARSADLRARFEQEARATNKLRHPGAVEIRDIDVAEDGCPFLVMELLEGENLGDRAARLGGIEEGEMLRLVDELLEVLAAAHAAAIVHRDIKLENLFVTTDGKLKVLDFGIARMISGHALTRTGMRLGTTSYMSPEQVRGKDVDGRADVFAVGATMFRLVARRRIHEADTDAELVAKMAADPAPPLASVARVSPELAMVVDRALAFDVEQRYPSATAMRADVAALRRGEPPEFAIARLAATPAPFVPEATSVDPSAHRSQLARAEPTAIPSTAAPGTVPDARSLHPVHQAPVSVGAYPAYPPSSATPAPPPAWAPASTFAATAPQSFAGHVHAAPPFAHAAQPTPPSSRVGIVAAVVIAGVCVLGGVGLAIVGMGARGSGSSSARDEASDDDTRPSHGKRKRTNDDVDDAAPATTTVATTTSPTIPAPVLSPTTPGRAQPGQDRAASTGPASPPPIPGLGAAFPQPTSSAKLPPGIGGIGWPSDKAKKPKGKGVD